MLEVNSYSAGLFDGEGWIGVTVNRNGLPKVQAAISLRNIEPIYTLQKAFGGNISSTRNRSGNTMWRIDFASRECKVKFLTSILPFLILKKKEVELALELLSAPLQIGKRLSEEERNRRVLIASKMKEVANSRRGVN